MRLLLCGSVQDNTVLLIPVVFIPWCRYKSTWKLYLVCERGRVNPNHMRWMQFVARFDADFGAESDPECAQGPMPALTGDMLRGWSRFSL